MLDRMKTQFEKGRFSLYLSFSHLIYCFFLKKELLLHQIKRSEEVFHHQPPVSNEHLIFFEHIRDQFQKDLFHRRITLFLDRAKHFTNACSMISFESIVKIQLPSDHHAACLAKHFYINASSCFGNMEASINDMVYVLFNALGSNDGDLITVYVSYICSPSIPLLNSLLDHRVDYSSQCLRSLCVRRLI